MGSLAVLFGVELLLTRTLGREQYDLVVVGLSWLAILAMVSSLGLPTALLRFLPADHAHARFGAMRGAMGWTARVMFLVGAGAGVLLALAVLGLGAEIGREQRTVLLVLALAVPLQVLNMHRQAVLQGLKHPVLALLPEQVIRPLAVAAILLVVRALHSPVTASDAAWILVAALLAGLLFGQYWKVRRTPPAVRQAVAGCERRVLLATALPLGWVGCMQMLSTRADPALLGWLGQAGDAALFNVADRMATLLLFGLIAVNAVVAPLISELYATDRRAELGRLLRRAAGGIALFTIPLAAVLLAAGPYLLTFFGEGFGEAYRPLVFLVLGQTANALAGSVGYLLMMTGHQGVAARLLTACAILKIVLDFALIPAFGATGAAVASAVMLVVLNGSLYLVVWRRLGLDPTLLCFLRRPPAAPADPE